MPATTPNRLYPYPIPTDPVDVPGDIQRLAEAIDDDLENNVVPIIQPRPAAQVRVSQPFSVPANVLQTPIPYDSVDYDNGGFFKLAANPFTMTLQVGSVYWVYAWARFPMIQNAVDNPYCRIEILSLSPSGTAVVSQNVHTEEIGTGDTGIRNNIVMAGALWSVNSVNISQLIVSVRHNGAGGAPT